jgi:hypothetical protein
MLCIIGHRKDNISYTYFCENEIRTVETYLLDGPVARIPYSDELMPRFIRSDRVMLFWH